MNSVPWMTTINTNPWNSTQGLYPRVVSVSRINTVAGAGDAIGNVGYSGAEQGSGPEGEMVLLTGLAASIQVGAVGRTTKSGDLPGDAVSKTVWTIFIPVSTGIVQYSIRDRDILIDDEGYRYEVGANFWTASGYQLSTVRLEA